jgi:hypothetical protein
MRFATPGPRSAQNAVDSVRALGAGSVTGKSATASTAPRSEIPPALFALSPASPAPPTKTAPLATPLASPEMEASTAASQLATPPPGVPRSRLAPLRSTPPVPPTSPPTAKIISSSYPLVFLSSCQYGIGSAMMFNAAMNKTKPSKNNMIRFMDTYTSLLRWQPAIGATEETPR